MIGPVIAADPTPDAVTGIYYQLESATAKWDDARFDAMSRLVDGQTGHLVAILNERENQIVNALGGSVDKWIGLTDSESTSTLDSFDMSSLGTEEMGNTSGFPLPTPGLPPTAFERGSGFAWLTTEPYNYQNWRAGAPGNQFEYDAVFMIIGGQWQDADGGSTLGQPETFGPTLKRYVIEWETALEQGIFRVVERRAAASFNSGSGNVSSLARADDLLAIPLGHSDLAAEFKAETFVISFQDPEAGGGVAEVTRTPFLSNQVGVNDEHFAWRATARVIIPNGGEWTFAVASGDGFRLKVGGNTFLGDGIDSAANPRLTRSTSGTLTAAAGGSGDTFYFPTAGIYPLVLTGFESDFIGFNQLFAVEGDEESFDIDVFDLVGNELFGGLALAPCPLDLALRIETGPGGVGYRLCWNGIPGSTYRVEFSPTLDGWGEVSGDIAGTHSTTFDHEPVEAFEDEGFYRVIQVN